MNASIRFLGLVTVLLIVVCPVFSQPLLAQVDSPLDLVIVIDNSKSMTVDIYGRADPEGLRYVAAKMLIDLASDQDRIGVVHFATEARSLTPQLVLMDSVQERNDLKELIDLAQTNDEQGEFTNYGKALDEAHHFLQNDTGNRRAVIFLTDGLPNDEEPFQHLVPFQNDGIPVFLLMLRNQRGGQSTELLQDVENAFSLTGPLSRQIDAPHEIARAFAEVITELQPNTYLDSLLGVPEGNNTLRFEAQATDDQKISQATFVFVPARSTSNFVVSPRNKPLNTDEREIPESQYTVYSYESNNAQPITGGWLFSTGGTNETDVESFVFIRADVRLQLIYPSGSQATNRRVMVAGQPLLLGVTLQGLAVDEAVAVEARIQSGERCSATNRIIGQPFQLTSVGISPNNTVFWSRIDDVSTDNIVVNVELKRLDRPLRLLRCFTIESVSPIPDALQIIRPTVSDPLEEGSIPLQVSLSSAVTWNRVEAFVESPGQTVEVVSLLATDQEGIRQGVAREINIPGEHHIRFVAQGTDIQGNSITFFRETTYTVVSYPRPEKPIIDLGTIRELNTVLSDEIRLDAPLIQQSTPVSFQVTSIKSTNDNQDVASSVSIELCSISIISQGQVQCPFTVAPANDLSPGIYEAEIKIEAPGQRLELDTIFVRFERLNSVLILPDESITIGSITPDTPLLTHKLDFETQLWEGDPLLPGKLPVIELRDLRLQQPLPDNYIEVELRPTASPNELDYDLILKPIDELPAGNYEARIRLQPGISHLAVRPEQLILLFDKPGAFVDLGFAATIVDYEESVWGLPAFPRILPPLFRTTAYLPVAVTTYYMTGLPDLPSPAVVQIKQGNTTIDPSAIQFSWREEGKVDGETDQYRASLILNVVKSIPAGTYNVRIQSSSPIRGPQEQIVRISILGWRSFFWVRFLPFVFGVLVIAKIKRGTSRSFRGTLVVEGVPLELKGKQDLQIDLDENGMICLRPDDGNSEVIVRCINQEEIEIDFKDGDPLRIRRGEELSENLAYI